jgi:hypothetical protein
MVMLLSVILQHKMDTSSMEDSNANYLFTKYVFSYRKTCTNENGKFFEADVIKSND